MAANHGKTPLTACREWLSRCPWWLWWSLAALCFASLYMLFPEYPWWLLAVLPLLVAAWLAARAQSRSQPRKPEPIARRPREVGHEHVSPDNFRLLVAEAFRRCGFEPAETTAAQGEAFLVHNGTGPVLVQCRYWKALQVGLPPVRELQEQLATEDVHGAYLVTCGVFTREAIQAALESGIEPVDGDRLRAMIRGSMPELAPPQTAAAPVPVTRVSKKRTRTRQGRRSSSART